VSFRYRNTAFIVVALLALASLSTAQSQTTPQTKDDNVDNDLLLPGVVVAEVTPGWGGARAGLQKGDILLSWSRGDVGGKIESPFAVMWLETEQRPRGIVSLEGLRDQEKKTWNLHSEYWVVQTAPHFVTQASPGSSDGLETAKVRLAGIPAKGNVFPWLRAWLSLYSARTLAKAHDSKEADFAFQQALGALPASAHFERSCIWVAWGDSALALNNFVAAEGFYSKALEEALGTGSNLRVANILKRMGSPKSAMAEYALAKDYYLQALQILRENAGDTFDGTYLLVDIGEMLFVLGDLSGADHYLQEAELAGFEPDPENKLLGQTLVTRGNIEAFRGNLARAEGYFRRAMSVAGSDRSSPKFAQCIDGLGNVAFFRGDFRRARELFERVLEIDQRDSPESLVTGNDLVSLAMVIRRLGYLDKAERYYKEALRINQVADGSGVYLGNTLSGLGALAWQRGDLAAAEKYFLQNDEIQRRFNPKSFIVAQNLGDLGQLAIRRGDTPQAKRYFGEMALLLEKNGPASARLAECLSVLGGIARREGVTAVATQYYKRALAVSENQTTRLGGSTEARASFRAERANYYIEYADLLISQHKLEAAFDVLERSRARTLLETLAAAQVNIRKGADPALLDRQRDLQADVHAKSERRIRLLGEKESKERDEQVKQVEKEVAGLLAELPDVESQLRSSSPGYAALTQPQPLTAKQIQQQLLDPNTVLLEYSLGEERSYVFAVTQSSLQAFELPKRAEIERAARRVYDLLTIRNHPVKGESEDQTRKRQAQAETEYPAAAAELSRMVLGSVSAKLGGKRLLVVADGALQYIPFAMLPDPARSTSITAARRQQVPLVVNHEIVNLPSASVLAVLRQEAQGRKHAPKAVAVIADPVFDLNDSRLTAAMRPRAPAVHLAGTSATRGAEPASGTEDSETTQTASVAKPVEAAATPVQAVAEVTKKDNTAAPDPLADLLGDDLLNEADSTSAHLLTRSADDLGLSRDGKLSLPRLLFSRQEADAIRAVTPVGQVKEAVDFQASRSAALSPDLRNYRIVHFATHGLLNSEHPELSGLVFSLVDEHGQPQDGFLQLQDIYNLDLPADLVVLSACETGLGKEINGEGLIGLTRGFMYAGATRVVASLWNVSDAATASLMAEFYRAMEKDHMPPAAALRAAQIHMWQQKRWSSPYYWAAFQIQGEWK